MTQHQTTMLREARRVSRPGEELELVDMAEVLLEAGFPIESVAESLNFSTQGNVSRQDRLNEALDITRAWPPEALVVARRYGAVWHAVREPARWWRRHDAEREEIVDFAMRFVTDKGRWPTVDEFRRAFGFAAGHKGPGEVEGQESLIG